MKLSGFAAGFQEKKRSWKHDISGRTLLVGAAAVVALKLLFCHFQLFYTWVGGAPLDDELMFSAAQSISAGQWLGAYNELTLSKSMFFAVWLALLHLLHLPYLAGGQLLWCSAAGLTAAAFGTVMPKGGKNRGRLLLFALLALEPAISSAYSLRVYRDNIFPALCLLCIAGFSGAVLRAAAERPKDQPLRLWPWLLAAGLGLSAAWLTREDAAVFLLPFALAGTGLLAVLLWRQSGAPTHKKHHPAAILRGAGVLALPFGLVAAGVLTVCGLNWQYYGLFALSDFSSGSFADAIGAMSRVAAAGEYQPLVSIPQETRSLLYAQVPELKRLEPLLEQDAQFANDFKDPVKNDYRSGSFYWAIRRAAQQVGVYASAQTADAYWRQVADAINAGCEAGTLPSRGAKRSGTAPAIRAEVIAPTLAEAAKSAVWALTFQDCAPYESLRSIGTAENFAEWESYLHDGANGAAEAGKDTPYYSPGQKLAYRGMNVLRWVYALALPVAFFAALVLQLRRLVRGLRCALARKKEGGSFWRVGRGAVCWLWLVLLLGLAAYRCGMIAFVEVASFGIGTSTMYLASVHPLLLIFAAVGIVTGWPRRALAQEAA